MKLFFLGLSCLTLTAFNAGAENPPLPRDFAVSPLPLTNVQFVGGFLGARLETNRLATIPALLAHYGNHPDLRLLEAACYELEQAPNPQLKARIDAALDAEIASIRRDEHVWPSAGDGSFFNAGNFLETAVAYYEATGSRKLLDVAIELGDDLDATFGPNKRHDISNHEGVEIGLVRLYRCTGNEKYLRVAQFLVDTRGNPAGRTKMFGSYAQDQAPIIEQTRAIGHAVRATYLYIPLTDLAGLTGKAAYATADQRIWEDAMSKRTFLTGGFGSRRDKEEFGDDYELPNAACWNEICAAYGGTMWNWHMFLLTQDGRYADMMERTLYNALLAGVSQKGDEFLYQAPLKAFDGFGRQSWFGPNCCPPNVARLLAQLGRLAYAGNENSLYVNLYANSTARFTAGKQAVEVTQETKYPWEGDVKISVKPAAPAKFAVYLRIPGWAHGNGWPTGLYRDVKSGDEQGYSAVAHISGTAHPISGKAEKGYVKVESEWKAGDWIELKLQMPVRRIMATEEVADDRGMVALARGPLVYCVEKADNAAGVFNLMLPDKAGLQFAFRSDLLGGMGTINGTALALNRNAGQTNLTQESKTITAIPYYAFANRTRGEMEVWVARTEEKAEVGPAPTIASLSRASSSCSNGAVADDYPNHRPPSVAQRMYPLSQDGSGDIHAIQDTRQPVNSEDGSGRFLRLRPQQGDNAWVQYDFASPQKISSVEVYWKDDKQYCPLPKSWRVLYRDGSEWKPVDAAKAGPVENDKFNKEQFAPVTTSALRLEITLQEKIYKPGDLGPPDANYMAQDEPWYEGGVIEWRVDP
jgi:uncharacterized protein